MLGLGLGLALKETTFPIHPQTAITRDNVHVQLDGAVYAYAESNPNPNSNSNCNRNRNRNRYPNPNPNQVRAG